MVRVVMRVVGALLALAGLGLAVVGVWFATQLGGTGTATFTASPGTARPVVLPPEVLNRVDADITVTATPGEGSRVWMALANPSDATAVLGDARHVVATGVDVRDWVLETEQRGTTQATEVTDAELWRDQDDADEAISMTVSQANAPETVVIVAEEGTLASLTMTISDKTWFVEAVVIALVGLFLVVVGLVLAVPRRHRDQDGPERAPTTAAEPAPESATATDAASDESATDGASRESAALTTTNPPEQPGRTETTKDTTP